MKTVNVSGLKNNPSEALRMANNDLSLVRATKLADLPLASFIAHISRLGLSVISQTEEDVSRDVDTLDQWLKEV